MLDGELQNRFGFHPAESEAKRVAHSAVRAVCLSAARDLDRLLPDGREKSSAISCLENAMFWGNAAVARPARPVGPLGEVAS